MSFKFSKRNDSVLVGLKLAIANCFAHFYMIMNFECLFSASVGSSSVSFVIRCIQLRLGIFISFFSYNDHYIQPVFTAALCAANVSNFFNLPPLPVLMCVIKLLVSCFLNCICTYAGARKPVRLTI
jgi:hypothetical protein